MRPRAVAAVLCGGTLGTLARYGLSMVIPSPGGWPLPILLINIAGAFLLGVFLEALVRRGPEGRRRITRLAVGTGFLGAFTTYSTLALDAVQLGVDQDYLGATLYLMLSLMCGVLASAAGIWTANTHHRRAAGTGQRKTVTGRQR